MFKTNIYCDRFVGYVEEEACSTYTKIIKAIENAPEGSELGAWRTEKPPQIAIAYWKLGQDGTVLDLMKAVRADEAEHRYVLLFTRVFVLFCLVIFSMSSTKRKKISEQIFER